MTATQEALIDAGEPRKAVPGETAHPAEMIHRGRVRARGPLNWRPFA